MVAIVIVLRRDKTMNRTTRFLLQMLALSDVMFYVLRPLIDVMELFSKHMEWSEVYFTLDSLLSASQTITAWMTVIVTYQRYVAISRPLHAHQYVTMSRARAAVAVVWISSIIIYSPFCCLELIFYENWELIRCVYYVIIIVTVFAFPMSMTVLFNIRLIVVTRKSIAFVRQNLPRGFTYTDNSDNRIASSRLRVSVTLIVIVIVYLVCQLPMTAVEILTAIVHSGLIDPSFCDYHWFRLSLLIAYNTSLCLIVVNSLADCVTYCIMGKRFRQSLLRKLNNVKTIKRRLGIQDKQPRT
jgi:hypothetical protein